MAQADETVRPSRGGAPAIVPARQEVRRGRAFVRVYATLVVLAAVALVALALAVRGDDLLRFDVAVTRAIQSVHLPLYGWALTHESDLGFPPLDWITYVAVFGVLFACGLRLEAVLAVGSSLGADLVGGGVKLLVERARPSGALVHVAAHLSSYSFPSGHVIQYTTLFGFAFYVAWVAWRRSALRTLVLVLLALVIVLVGPSRVYLGEHWPSDTIGAYLLGGLWLAGTIELHLWLKRRSATRESAAGQRSRPTAR